MCWSAFFQHLPISGHSYCVDGFIVLHQSLSGTVMRERIELVSSYSFEWNQEVQTVTVEAYNSLGSSANNIKMTLERQPKRESAGTLIDRELILLLAHDSKVVFCILITVAWLCSWGSVKSHVIIITLVLQDKSRNKLSAKGMSSTKMTCTIIHHHTT